MNIKLITSTLFVLLSSVLFFSCNKSNSDIDYTNLTNDAQIYSFSLTAPIVKKGDSLSRAQDSVRIVTVNKTNYAIDQLNDIIYNPDSLPYLTKLQNVLVKVSFNPTYGVSSIQVERPDSLYTWNTTDSINFSKLPINFIVTAFGGKKKTYKIDIRTHKIDPDTIIWKQMPSLSYTGESKSIAKLDSIYTYILSGGKINLNASSRKNIKWIDATVSGLPTNINMESFQYANSRFNVNDKSGNSYESTNGRKWAKVTNSLNVTSVVGVLPTSQGDLILSIIEEDGEYYFAKGSTLSNLQRVQSITGYNVNNVPSDFPISGIASYSNQATSSAERMLVVTGGLSQSGNNLNNTWLIQNTSTGIEIAPFVQTPPFKGGAGLSLFGYDSKFYTLENKQFYISSDWGANWIKAPQKQSLITGIKTNKGQSVIVDEENYIWILGGVSTSDTYLNEVWRGRLNKLIP